MLKQLKRARDRFFGAGEADTSVPVLDGPLKPNHILENAEVFFEATGLEGSPAGRRNGAPSRLGSEQRVAVAHGSGLLLGGGL